MTRINDFRFYSETSFRAKRDQILKRSNEAKRRSNPENLVNPDSNKKKVKISEQNHLKFNTPVANLFPHNQFIFRLPGYLIKC